MCLSPPGGYAAFNALKQYNSQLRTLLAIGGWNEGSGRFSELVSLPEYRQAFVLSAVKHLRRYSFDGLDLDWEYPSSRAGSAPEDKENYALLVKVGGCCTECVSGDVRQCMSDGLDAGVE